MSTAAQASQQFAPCRRLHSRCLLWTPLDGSHLINNLYLGKTSGLIGVFFLALYLISLGTSGHKPSLKSFGADWFDEEDKTKNLKKNSFFNLWYFGLCNGTLSSYGCCIH